MPQKLFLLFPTFPHALRYVVLGLRLFLDFSGIGTRLSPGVFKEVVRSSTVAITLRRWLTGSTDESYL